MTGWLRNIILILLIIQHLSCENMAVKKEINQVMTAEKLLGNDKYQAICYGGYRHKTREIQPTIDELKEDLKILYALGIRLIRTYNVHLPEVPNLIKAIKEIKQDNPDFELYLMLGAWIDCKNAWTHLPADHSQESEDNAIEINKAIELANLYPDIVKIIAVGNEAMVKWATNYYVQQWVILKWVNYLQNLKKEGKLAADLWITSSDNFASWGGGSEDYHVEALKDLIKAVDFISIHTYPMHDTHYNPDFWGILLSEVQLSDEEKIQKAMMRARDYAIHQYQSVVKYMNSLGISKPVHIGETGWSSKSNEHYGPEGSRATDEYKAAVYYHLMKEWCTENNVTCFYFEAFDEQWKDQNNADGSENHFGLINLNAQAKYALWDVVDMGVFDGLTRDGKPITKTYGGDFDSLWIEVKMPPLVDKIKVKN